MPYLRFVALVLATVSVAVAIKCYNGQMNSNQHPGATTDCNSNYCTKAVLQFNGQTTYSYGCDQTQLCNKEGCYNADSKNQICCCGKDLCNSSTKLSALFAVVPIALMKFLAF